MKTPCLLLALLLSLGALRAAPEYPDMGPDIYDPKADGKEQIAHAVRQATADHKRILVMMGANWCIWCRRLHEVVTTAPEVTKAIAKDFILVMVDVNPRGSAKRNVEVDKQLGHPTKFGFPVFVVLDADGHVLTIQETNSLGDKTYEPARVVAFLEKWK